MSYNNGPIPKLRMIGHYNKMVMPHGEAAMRQDHQKSGASCGTRTRDLLITNQLLYQLS